MSALHRPGKLYTISDWTLLVAFLLLLAVPGVGLAMRWETSFEKTEGRRFATWPATTRQTLYQDQWRDQVDNFVNDQFGFRSQLITWNNQLSIRLFGRLPSTTQQTAPTRTMLAKELPPPTPTPVKTDQPPLPVPAEVVAPTEPPQIVSEPPRPVPPSSPSKPVFRAWTENKALVGKDGWLYVDMDGAIDSYRCVDPFTDDELATIRTNVERDRDVLAAQGIDFVLLLVPDKHSVYPEYLPDTVKQLGQVCRYQQVVNLFKPTSIHVVDALPPLLAEKASQRVYHKTDSHWNQRGAFVGYVALMKTVTKLFPNIVPHTWDDYKRTESATGGQDLARILSLEKTMRETLLKLEPQYQIQAAEAPVTFPDPNPRPTRNPWGREVPDPSLPRSLIFRDSFFNALSPFVTEHFSRSVSVWTPIIMPSIVKVEKPDVVILQVVERRLQTSLLDQKPPG